MAGPQYPDYFPKQQKHSAFNRVKYETYFLYLKAKDYFFQKRQIALNTRKQELHGNVYVRNSRSRAGLSYQTREVNLVVSALGPGILLSSVIRVQPRTLN